MTLYYLTPISAIFQYFNDVGVILSGGKINTYIAGSSVPQATYIDITGGTPNSNPIILASNGRLNNVQIWQPGGVNLKIVITDANNNQLGPVFDQISGINDPAATNTALANPATGSGADLVANAVRSFGVLGDVRASNAPSLSAGQTKVIELQGSISLNDGYGGLFYWDASSVLAEGFSVIKLTNTITGRYRRLITTGLKVSKQVSTSVTSSTALALDPELFLQFPSTSPDVVTYEFRALLLFNGTTSGAGGIAFNFYSQSTIPNNLYNLAIGSVNGSSFSGKGTWTQSATPQITSATITASGSGNDALFLSGMIQTAFSTVGIKWAQNSSNANATNILVGSWISLTPAN